jgi:succinate dehydrogenase / fumarate reductase flavoprotein subunit
VFGRRAGLAAAQDAKKIAAPTIDLAQIEAAEREAVAPFEATSTDNPYTIHHDLQNVMQNLVGIFRTDADLQQALVELEKLKTRAKNMHVEGSRLFNPGWHLSIDLRCMLTVSEAAARAALARTESRGAHSRLDFPKTEDEWSKKNQVIVKKGDAMTLFEVPRPEMPAELAAILDEGAK